MLACHIVIVWSKHIAMSVTTDQCDHDSQRGGVSRALKAYRSRPKCVPHTAYRVQRTAYSVSSAHSVSERSLYHIIRHIVQTTDHRIGGQPYLSCTWLMEATDWQATFRNST